MIFILYLVSLISENCETKIDLFGTNLSCEKHSEVFEGIAHFIIVFFFVKISITIKANGFHIFSEVKSSLCDGFCALQDSAFKKRSEAPLISLHLAWKV